MNYNIQMQEWLSKHQDATLEEAWRAGYMTCTDNWCGGKREKLERIVQLIKEIIG
jgi:hypothetical protein